MAIAAGVVFGLSLVLLTAFFRTQDARMDLVATWGFVVFAVLIIPVMLTVRDRLGAGDPAATALAGAGILGAGVLGVAEAMLGLKLIDFRRVALVTTLGFVLVLVWIGGVSALVLGSSASGLPANLGWLGLASIVMGLAILVWIVRKPGVVTGETEPSQAALIGFFLPLAGIVAWLGWLGLIL
jgi:hypothetical protein